MLVGRHYAFHMTTPLQVQETASACVGFLGQHVDADWARSIPDLDISVAEVVGHMAEGNLWYAIDLAAGGSNLSTVEHRVKTDRPASELLDTLQTYASVLAAVVEASPPTERGFHPMGLADASGFAAMACDEMLIHTYDAACGIAAEFNPPDRLAAATLHRLFPWIDELDGDPWTALRYANGRIALPGRPRLDGWAWHCAPLDEWDGQPARLPST